MNWKETKIALLNYRDYVISQSKRNLSLRKMGNSKLYKSLRGVVLNQRNRLGQFTSGSPELTFYMNYYGKFVDEGVKGTKDTDIDRNSKPNKFDKNKKFVNLSAVESFMNKKRIRLRGKDGKFTRGSRNSIKFAIARSIHQKGIKRSLFFTKPLLRRQKMYYDQIHEGAANDVTNHIVKLIETKWLQK
jgi:hypothetical protein